MAACCVDSAANSRASDRVRSDWLIELLPFIRFLANEEYGRYPLECVQDADDIINATVVELLEYVRRRGRVPARSSLENKVRLIIRRVVQGNHRLGMVARDGRELPVVEERHADDD